MLIKKDIRKMMCEINFYFVLIADIYFRNNLSRVLRKATPWYL